jgi:hypothetical protein
MVLWSQLGLYIAMQPCTHLPYLQMLSRLLPGPSTTTSTSNRTPVTPLVIVIAIAVPVATCSHTMMATDRTMDMSQYQIVDVDA